MDKAVLVLSALLLNSLLAGPRRWYAALGLARLGHYPVTLIRDFERRLNREHRSLADRQLRGAFLLAAVIIVCLLVGWLLQHGLIELLILAIALPVRPTWDIAAHIRKCLKRNDTGAARQTLEGTAWRHHALLDDHGLSRAAIEILAVHFSEKIVGPVFWYMLLGLPGLLVSKSVYLLQETLVRPGDGQGFGKAAKMAHYVMHYVPARLAAVLWLAASIFLPSSNIKQAAKQLAAILGKASPQVISVMSAALALDLSLGGPTSIYTENAWLGTGTPKASAGDIKRALMLFALLHLLLFLSIGILF